MMMNRKVTVACLVIALIGVRPVSADPCVAAETLVCVLAAQTADNYANLAAILASEANALWLVVEISACNGNENCIAAAIAQAQVVEDGIAAIFLATIEAIEAVFLACIDAIQFICGGGGGGA